MKSFKEYLEEKTFSINNDVDLIYRSVFQDFINNLKRGIVTKLPMVSFSSEQLQSKDAKAAHEVNPIEINAGIDEDGSYYAPLENRVVLSFNDNVLKAIKHYGSLEELMRYIGPEQRQRLQQEINGSAIKYTIFHELSHWIDDSLHGRHLTKTIDTASKIKRGHKRGRVLSRGRGGTTETDYEINAQIHSIKRAKLQNKKTWDSLTFDEMLNLVPSVHVVNRNLRGKSKDVWRKNIKRRMAREGLLGKNMR
jgi:hypothetical protein